MVEWKHTSGKPTPADKEAPEKETYRVGADGKVQLKLVTPSLEKYQVYIDHLPVLGLYIPIVNNNVN